MAKLRRMPWPYKAMLAISTDIDEGEIPIFRELHRFFNTEEETMFGPGVGLDIADSCWLYGKHQDWPLGISVFDGHDSAVTRPTADEILGYMRGPWIDTLHSYGNFTKGGFTRKHAEAAIDLCRKERLRFKVWTNHGGGENSQNLLFAGEGDLPESPSYHGDLIGDLGVQFLNRDTVGAFANKTMIRPTKLRDGRKIWSFERFWRCPENKNKPLWHPASLHLQLSAKNLDELTRQESFAIVAQHILYIYNRYAPYPEFFAALRDLRARQDRGEILVASTSRLLEFNRVRDHLKYAFKDGKAIIEGVDDPVQGFFVPTLEQLRGIGFDGASEIYLGAERIAESELVRDGDTVAVAWRKPDRTDYAADAPKLIDLAPASERETWKKAIRAAELALEDVKEERRYIPPPQPDSPPPWLTRTNRLAKRLAKRLLKRA